VKNGGIPNSKFSRELEEAYTDYAVAMELRGKGDTIQVATCEYPNGKRM